MLIQDMPPESTLELIRSAHFGRIACSRGAQPYVTPFSFAYHDEALYSFATVGQKIEWMRTDPLVCVQVDEVVSAQDWKSVVIFGRYQELTETPELCDARARAHDLLARTASWWEPGYVKTIHQGVERPLVPLYFRVCIDAVTGHQGVADLLTGPPHKTVIM